MWTKELLGTDFYHIVHWFFVYSILGWLVESVYMSLCNKKVTNRGFIKGPICPIYGVGALTVFFILRPFAGNYVALYILGTLLATTIEFVTAKVMIRLLGNVWWDYNDKPFNYKGILCLESTIAWGFYTVILFAFLQSAVEKIVDLYPFHIGKYIGAFLIIYYAASFLMGVRRAMHGRAEEQMYELWNE